MRRFFRYLTLVAISMVGLIGCDFDHLYYETSLKALVRVDVDWSETDLEPNGVSAYVYDASGALCSQVLSSDPEVVFLKLSAGEYTVVVHNNSTSELGGVALRGMQMLESSSIYATERSGEAAFEVPERVLTLGDASEVLLINEPDDVASCTLRGVEISSADIEYHYYKPSLSDYEQECNYVFTARPRHIVHTARVIAKIAGLDNASGVPTAILSGMSGGYMFGEDVTANEAVMEEFKVNTRVTKGDEEADDAPETIYVDYNTFGMHTVDSASRKYYLDMRFNLVDGSYKDYHVDVTGSITTDTTKNKTVHTISVELEALPEVEGGGDEPGESYDDGTFDPTLDEWLDIEVELQM